MSISIVIVTYNSSSKILRLVKSIIKSKTRVKELIIVDNNSPDREILKKILSRYQEDNQNFKLIPKYLRANNGFAFGCNYGFRHTSSTYVLFLNPDTELSKNSLDILFSHTLLSNADISGGKSVQFRTNELHRTVYNKPNLSTLLYEFSNLGKLLGRKSKFYLNQRKIVNDTSVDGVGGAFLLVKSVVFRKLHGFDEKMFMYLEDVDFCMRAKDKSYNILYCPHSTIHHIGGASTNNKHRIVHKAWYNSRVYFVRKHFNHFLSIFISLLYRAEQGLLTIRESARRYL